ncbi:hypothetical protein HpBGD119_13960 [Helicobacter pylori]
MRNYHSLSSFILIVKNTQRHQFDYQYSIKNFYRLYNAQRFLRNKTLSLPQKKLKSLRSKDFKKVMVFKRDSPNTGWSDRELKA